VGLDDGHLDVEGSNFVGETLADISSAMQAPRIPTSQNPSRAHPEAQYIPNPGVPRWPAKAALSHHSQNGSFFDILILARTMI